ncbi:hypothetical protein [Streptomyces durhamensis]|uniref:hypothetical protein n=1 Tax=Streptomyces durhamensis TaxID=68194 RepID=UPI000A930418|nr:hypothetical protein [Streptomyces durhamensis]
MTHTAVIGALLTQRGQEMSLREIAARLVITKGAKKGQPPLPRNRHAHAARARRTDSRRTARVRAGRH